MKNKIIATAILAAIAFLSGFAALKATSADDSEDGGGLKVAATYYPLYDFTRQVGGDRASARNMTPAGSEPHDYDPSPQALIEAHNATVFIHNGSQMEPWVESFLVDYKNTTVNASRNISMLHNSDEREQAGHEEEDHGSGDPHFWLDPVLAQQIVDNIRDGLSQAYPKNSEYYSENARQYNQKLAELDRGFSEGLANCTLDTAISSHGAFSYLAHRYDFTVESIAGIEPDDEPSPAKMAELTKLVRQKNIQYIFFESLVSPRLAETIARETGAKTLVFDPIEGLSQEDQNKGRDYLSVQYDNLANLRKALDCK